MAIGRPKGSINKTRSKAAELFEPHLAAAIATLIEIHSRKTLVLYEKIEETGEYKAVAQYSAKDSDRIAAAKIIAEYVIGRPVQPTVLSGPEDDEGNPTRVVVEVVHPK